MHQPIKWWAGLVALALVWCVGNFLKTEIVEADLTTRSRAAVAALPATSTDKTLITVVGRDVTLSGKSLAAQISAADTTFGVRKVIASLTAAPVAAAPLPVLGVVRPSSPPR